MLLQPPHQYPPLPYPYDIFQFHQSHPYYHDTSYHHSHFGIFTYRRSDFSPRPVELSPGGAIGGVVLIALVLLALLLLHRHRRRHHTAPSAEFMSSGNLVLPRVVSPPLDSGRAESFSSMTQLNTGYASTGQANAPGNYNYPFTENLSRVTPL
ncbi:hypothetical protein BT96DRAFT_987340 [Gymnopus androsaceus JB14]|uniref:Uncharacterized protein n=1 Tax=Gymnopus androsaceus JB14 TaxID=1447944 RepID=A0A6A4I865_9AGAR|nr:hypothetical protein BT96DRAFT_987340 [Gymnopus androsaceus JB14]